VLVIRYIEAVEPATQTGQTVMVFLGQRVVYQRSGLKMTNERDFEIASLLPDRWYIILNKVDDDNFRMSAYDTTNSPEVDEELMDAGFVTQQGIIELLENDFERVLQAGLARISFSEMKQSVLDDLDENDIEVELDEKVTKLHDNVIKVDFGSKQ
jgi:hypothetical protein